MPEPIRYNSVYFDLATRFQSTQAVAGSPALAAETVIATLTLDSFNDIAVVKEIRLTGWAAFTVGTSGVSAQLRIRQTSVAGTVVADSGATSATAAQLGVRDVLGVDATPGVGVYVLTLQVASGAAASTVSAVQLAATIV